jgi:hypothetical protein
MRIGANGLEIERFAIADFGGATLVAKGRIDSTTQPPRGALALDLDARALDGLLPLLERFAPQAADQLRRAAGRLTPVELRSSLAIDPIAGSEAQMRQGDGRAALRRAEAMWAAPERRSNSRISRRLTQPR